jgi:hypothetical protein
MAGILHSRIFAPIASCCVVPKNCSQLPQNCSQLPPRGLADRAATGLSLKRHAARLAPRQCLPQRQPLGKEAKATD